MIVGILTHHWVYNYGANLQTLSTINFLRNNGHTPLVINWVQKDAEEYYNRTTKPEYVAMFHKFQELHYPLTEIVRNAEEIAKVIIKHSIEKVIVGSDTVFMLRKYKAMSESVFPNPFWGEFLNYGVNVPVIAYSAATLDIKKTDFLIEKSEISNYLKRFKTISTRDKFTSDVISFFTDGDLVPPITPDPVFSFNKNIPQSVSRESFLQQFQLPEKYVLLCITEGYCDMAKEWVCKLKEIIYSKGYELIELPRQTGNRLFDIRQVDRILNPIEWYNLIRFSNGYIGQLMHPIVIAIHNSIPFFSLDQYGRKRIRRIYVNKNTSKTYQLIKEVNMTRNYVNISGRFSSLPSVSKVVKAILNSDKTKEKNNMTIMNSKSEKSMRKYLL